MEESKEKVEGDKCNGELSVDQMIENVNKTKAEIRHRKYMNARARLSLKKFRKSNKVTIDLNVNIKK